MQQHKKKCNKSNEYLMLMQATNIFFLIYFVINFHFSTTFTQPTNVLLFFGETFFHHLQISDDDRMSLTTAISDEDDVDTLMASPYKAKAGTAAASFNCTGAVRKAG